MKMPRKWMPRKSTIERAAVVVGIALVTWGLFGIYRPLAPIFVGLVILMEVLSASPRENE
jgi:hypothetical protein